MARNQAAGFSGIVAIGVHQAFHAFLGRWIAGRVVGIPAIRLHETAHASRVRHVADRCAAATVRVGRARRHAVARGVAAFTVRTIGRGKTLDTLVARQAAEAIAAAGAITVAQTLHAVAGRGVADRLRSRARAAARGAGVACPPRSASRTSGVHRASPIHGTSAGAARDPSGPRNSRGSTGCASVSTRCTSGRSANSRTARPARPARARGRAGSIRAGRAASRETAAFVVATAARSEDRAKREQRRRTDERYSSAQHPSVLHED